MIDVINPATEEVFATIPRGTAEDVDRAVAGAKSALAGTWHCHFSPDGSNGRFKSSSAQPMEIPILGSISIKVSEFMIRARRKKD
jgi:hypothetical protein